MSCNRTYLEAAADRIMIQDLLARYAWELDRGSPEAWSLCFTHEGVFEAPSLGFRVAGRASLAAFARDVHRTLPDVHHVTTDFSIEFAAERAAGKCFLNEFMARPEGMYNNLQGWYEDAYVLDGNRWYLEHRRAFVVNPAAMGIGKVGEYFHAFGEAVVKHTWVACENS